MSDLHVEVATIDDIQPHQNADQLELAIIKGWQVVVQKGQHQPQDKVVFVPPDSVLPQELSDEMHITQYLSNGRLRAIKLRGEPSFGLIMTPKDISWELGQDVAEQYGIVKYTPPNRSWIYARMPGSRGLQHPDALEEHPLFWRYTNIDNLRHFPHILEDGEEVIVTEKLHGCLAQSTRITMSDRSLKHINNIERGDKVLGVDEHGRVVETTVLNTFNNGVAEKWLTVKGPRVNMTAGNSFWAVHCTPNHQFWNQDTKQYIAAEDLHIGDSVTMSRSDLKLTPIQEQVLIGKMLGDGYLHSVKYTAAVVWGHSEKQDNYNDWTAQALGDIALETKRYRVSGYGTKMVDRRTVSNIAIKELFQDWHKDGKKGIPESLEYKITPISMAFWYMDDGSLAHNEGQEDRACFAVCGFTEEDCKIILAALSRFGIQGVYYQSKGSRIRLNADNAERFFLLIAPYIPPSMQYKLPERYRGHQGWIPGCTNVYKPILVQQKIDSIQENPKMKSSRYDIETETHNFFANGVLVHNSNSRISVIQGEWMAGSHKVRRKQPDEYDALSSGSLQLGNSQHVYWYPTLIPAVRQMLNDLSCEYQQVILFGEILGDTIQSFHYGYNGQLGYRAFDLLLDGRYANYDDFITLCQKYGIDTVPLLARIPYSFEEIKQLSEGKTTLIPEGKGKKQHIREGVVVKPVRDRSNPKIGRVILKYVSDSYLVGKATDYTEE